MSLFKCPKCDTELRRAIKVYMDVPVSLFRFTKANLRKRGVKITAVCWDTQFIYCPNCGYNQNTKEC